MTRPNCSTCPELACPGRVTRVCPMGWDMSRPQASLTYADLGPDMYAVHELSPAEAGEIVQRINPAAMVLARLRLSQPRS